MEIVRAEWTDRGTDSPPLYYLATLINDRWRILSWEACEVVAHPVAITPQLIARAEQEWTLLRDQHRIRDNSAA